MKRRLGYGPQTINNALFFLSTLFLETELSTTTDTVEVC
jgi:hypothetical protein